MRNTQGLPCIFNLYLRATTGLTIFTATLPRSSVIRFLLRPPKDFSTHHKAHKAEYYCMSLKRWLWINGEALDQRGAVWPEITVMQFGTESTGCQRIIKTTIEHIRS